MSLLLLIIVVIVIVSLIPAWPHSRNWGYYPSAGVGTIVLIIVLLWLLGVLRF